MKDPVSSVGAPRLWNRDFVLICLVGLMTAVVMQLLSATLSVYVNHLGGTASFAGLLGTGFAVCAGVMRLVSGRFSDTHGRRLTMVAGAAIFAAGLLASGLVPDLTALFFFRCLQGIGFAMVSTAAAAAVADVTPRSRIGEGLGFFGLGQSLAMAFGPALGLAIVAGKNDRGMFYLCTLAVVVSLGLAMVSTYERRRKAESSATAARTGTVAVASAPDAPVYKGVWKVVEKAALPASLLQFVVCLAISSLIAFAGFYAVQSGFAEGGLFFTLEAAFMFVARLFAGKVFDRRGPLAVLVPGFFVTVCSFLLLSMIPGEAAFLVSGALFGISLGMTGPSMNALAVRHAPRDRFGASSALFFLSTDVGIGLGAVIWGFVLDAGGFPRMFLGAAGMTLVAVGLSFWTVRASKPVVPAVLAPESTLLDTFDP